MDAGQLKTYCKIGHALIEENIIRDGSYTRCKTCVQKRARSRHLRLRKTDNPYIPRSIPIHERHSIKLKQNQDRMWNKIDKSAGAEGCWPWTSHLYANGYGCMSPGNKPRRVTRLIMELETGSPLSSDVFVCHRCDNPICCNPAHLFLGSPLDNSRDRDQKGRGAIGFQRWNTKLTPEAVRVIREGNDRVADLAERFGVAKSTIYGVRNGSAATHVANAAGRS